MQSYTLLSEHEYKVTSTGNNGYKSKMDRKSWLLRLSMIIILILLMIIIILLATKPSGGTTAVTKPSGDILDTEWQKFKVKFKRRFDSATEELRRKQIFLKTWIEIVKHNVAADAGKYSFRLGVNFLADKTDEELDMYTCTESAESLARQASIGRTVVETGDDAVPDSVDWRTSGYVTPVKHQRDCGSCYAFSATAAIEGQHARETGELVSLSEQNLVDCSAEVAVRGFRNKGCKGGQAYTCFQYVIQKGGIMTEEDYPYTAREGTCSFDETKIGAKITDYETLPAGDEDQLKRVVAKYGPVSASNIRVSFKLRNYEGDILDDPACEALVNKEGRPRYHAMLIVGYGTENGTDYWIVKNSWGPGWGEDGYLRMSRNKNSQCGIADLATIPRINPKTEDGGGVASVKVSILLVVLAMIIAAYYQE